MDPRPQLSKQTGNVFAGDLNGDAKPDLITWGQNGQFFVSLEDELLEALGALLLLVFIVWWTMFSGRSEAEAEHEAAQREASQSDKPAP